MNYFGPSLRDRLRRGTRLAQDSLERAQLRLDLERPEALAAFLRAQRKAATSLIVAAPELADDLKLALERLDADLGPCRVKAPAGPAADDALGRGYVWHTQQMALQLRARRLPDAVVEGSAYLSAPRDAAAWREHCAVLESTPGHGAEAELSLRVANDWFALWESIHLSQARDPD